MLFHLEKPDADTQSTKNLSVKQARLNGGAYQSVF
jgi:hypothetical protein